MAKHKASTEVTVAPLFEKSALEQAVDRYKIPALFVLTVVVGVVLYSNISKQAAAKQLDGSWELFFAGTTTDPMTRLPSGSPESLEGLANSLSGKESGPWARLIEAQEKLKSRDFDGCLAALQKLRTENPQHTLVVTTQPLPDGSTSTVVAHLEAMAKKQQEWESKHPELFTASLPPADAPRVKLTTSAGVIELALFSEKAPKHVDNFLKLCRDGLYSGTRFHRVQRDFMIQGGDPNSKGDERATWGQGGPGYTIPAEPNGLYHFAGVLSAAKKPGDQESSGSQFFITTQPAHHLDGEHTVFGAVISGMDVVNAIAAGPLAEGTADQPQSPVSIDAAEVLP